CMLDRISSEAVTITYDERGSYIQNHPHMYTLIKDLFQPLEQKYAISIPDDEICYVMNFFEWGLQENTSLN
ncbi:PRD domain-containing protein, partial [Rossellomorea marisflavi]